MHVYNSQREGWHITKVNLDHDHDMKSHTGIISDKRSLKPWVLKFIEDQVTKVRCPTNILKRLLRHYHGVEVEDRLLYNLVARARLNAFGYGSAGESATLVKTLSQSGAVRLSLDSQARLEYMVYVSDFSKVFLALSEFCDVVLLDATHSTNRWGLYMVLLTGVGPFGKNVHLATFTMKDERPSSYQWCFEKLEEISPGFLSSVYVIFTDGLPAYNAVVQPSLFPHATHLRCLWHLERQISQHLSSSLGLHFRAWWQLFKSAIFQYEREGFEEAIADVRAQLLQHMGSLGRSQDQIHTAAVFFDGIIAIADKYATCALKELFTLGIRYSSRKKEKHEFDVCIACLVVRSTQRSESANFAAKCRTATKTYLGDFFAALRDMEQDQSKTLRVDYDNQLQRSRARVASSLLDLRFQAYLTLPAAQFFAGQVQIFIDDQHSYFVEEMTLNSDDLLFQVTRRKRDAATFWVTFHASGIIFCTCTDNCQKGYVCRHILAVWILVPDNFEIFKKPDDLVRHFVEQFRTRHQMQFVAGVVQQIWPTGIGVAQRVRMAEPDIAVSRDFHASPHFRTSLLSSMTLAVSSAGEALSDDQLLPFVRGLWSFLGEFGHVPEVPRGSSSEASAPQVIYSSLLVIQ